MTDIAQFIRDLNQTWIEQRYDDLHLFFHPQVIMLPPGGAPPLEGAEAMVESYRQFGAMGTVHAFDVEDITVYERGPLAMCHLRFTVDYEIEARRFRETGTEAYAIDTSGPKLKVVWRTQVPHPAADPTVGGS